MMDCYCLQYQASEPLGDRYGLCRVVGRISILADARQMLASALFDLAETHFEIGEALPRPDAQAHDAEMDIEEPIYLHLSASTQMNETPAGVLAP